MANPTAFCKPEDFGSIDQVETPSDTLTGRTGLALFSRYFLKVAAERLFDVDAVAGQVGKVDPTPHCKQHAKKPSQELPLPSADLAVVTVIFAKMYVIADAKSGC